MRMSKESSYVNEPSQYFHRFLRKKGFINLLRLSIQIKRRTLLIFHTNSGWPKPPTKLPFGRHEMSFGRHDLIIPTIFGRYDILISQFLIYQLHSFTLIFIIADCGSIEITNNNCSVSLISTTFP